MIEFELYDGTKLAWDPFMLCLEVIGGDIVQGHESGGMRHIYEIGDKILKIQYQHYPEDEPPHYCSSEHQAKTEAKVLNSIRDEHLKYFSRLYDVGCFTQVDDYEHVFEWILVSKSLPSNRESTQEEKALVAKLSEVYGIFDLGYSNTDANSNWWIDEDTDAPFIYDCGMERET